MASKLSEKIKGAATNLRQTQKAAPTGMATEQAFQQAAASKGTGGMPTPSGQSNISETLGVQQVRAEGEQQAQALDQQAATAQVAEAEQASADRQRGAAMLARKLEADTNYNQQIENQLNNYEQHSLDMDAAEEELALEDLGAKLALKDRKYQAELDRRAQAANLADQTAFREETAKLIMGEELKQLRDQIAFMEQQQKLDIANREDLAKIDINSALAAANAALQEDIAAQKSQAWSQLGGAAADIVGDKEVTKDYLMPKDTK